LLDLSPGPAIVVYSNDRLFEVLALDPALGALGILGDISGQALITMMVRLKSVRIDSSFAPELLGSVPVHAGHNHVQVDPDPAVCQLCVFVLHDSDVLQFRQPLLLAMGLDPPEIILHITLHALNALRQMIRIVGQVDSKVLIVKVRIDQPDQLLLGIFVVQILLGLPGLFQFPGPWLPGFLHGHWIDFNFQVWSRQDPLLSIPVPHPSVVPLRR